jgi:hypothetical protein
MVFVECVGKRYKELNNRFPFFKQKISKLVLASEKQNFVSLLFVLKTNT